MHLDTIDELALLRPAPSGRDKRNAMSRTRESAKNFVEVNFGTTRPRVLSVEPVEDENVERHQHRVRGRLSTPWGGAASPAWDETAALGRWRALTTQPVARLDEQRVLAGGVHQVACLTRN